MRIHVFGPVDGPTGYDHVTRSFVGGLFVSGHWVTLQRFTRWTADRVEHGYESVLNQCEAAQYPVDLDLMLNFCLPDQAIRREDCPNAIYTMFEASRIHKLWVEALKGMDLVLVPSQWNRDMFIDSGVNPNKIAVVPIGVDPGLYNAHTQPLPCTTDLGEHLQDFKHRFLCVQELVSRKNTGGLLKAWVRAVRPDDGACLILKAGSHSGDKLAQFKAKFVDSLSPTEKEVVRKTVLIHTRILPERYMPNLYATATHFISASCGEGWCLPAAFAGTLGKYLVVPDHTGFSGYVDESTAFVIKSSPEPAKQEGPTGKLYDGADWFKPNEQSAVDQIRASIQAANVGDRTKPEAMQARLKAFTIDRCTDVLLRVVDTFRHMGKYALREDGSVGDRITIPYQRAENFKNFCIYVKSLGTPCGIADYTMSLYSQLIRLNKDVHKVGSGILTGASDFGLMDTVDQNSLEVVHVQHEYQFISHQRLELLLNQLRARNIRSVITMHTVHKTVGATNSMLNLADAVVVSSNLMQDALVCLGIPKHKVYVIPMGIDPAQCTRSTAPEYDGKRPYRLGFFGFCYFHKGLDALILSMKFLEQLFGRGAAQLIIHSVKPRQDTAKAFERCQQLIADLQLQNVVTWTTDYCDEAEVVRRMAGTDLLCLPYSEYGGLGVSAAGRTAMKAGVPLLLTQNSFFHDLLDWRPAIDQPAKGGVVHQDLALVIDSPQSLHLALAHHLSNVRGAPVLQKTIVQNYTIARDQFAKQHSWEAIAQRHLDLYAAL